MKPKVAIIITYFGEFPAYIDYFFASCVTNPEFDFFIFGDAVVEKFKNYENIFFTHITLEEFNKLASAKTGVDVAIANGYKLCDFKPMYGLLFEDYITQYRYWAYCDVDIIFGNLIKTFNRDFLDEYDIISNHPLHMSGPFAIFKNVPKVNRLFLKSKDIKRVLLENRNFGFDEAGPNIMPKLWEGYKIDEIESEIESMSHLVMSKGNADLKVLFTDYLTERLPDDLSLIWRNGKLLDHNNKEYSVFHFLVYKNNLLFNIPPYSSKYKSFIINKNGFFLDNLLSYSFYWTMSISKNVLIKVRKRIKRYL